MFAADAVPRPAGRVTVAGILSDARLSEISGLAVSRRAKDRYWALNDSGNEAALYLIDGRGRIRSELPIEVQNIDWEALESFQWNGAAWLLIADTGDNNAHRDFVDLWLFEEPDPRKLPSSLAPKRRLSIRFPSKAYDVEAVTVDPVAGEILLLTKRTVPVVLYRVPLESVGQVTASRVAELQGILQPTAAEIKRDGALSRYRSQTTSMQLDCARTSLLILTYDSIYRYARAPDQRWEIALMGTNPSRSTIAFLPQAEAMTLNATCTHIIVGSEKTPSPLLRFRYRPLP